MAQTLTRFPQELVNQYSKSALQEIAREMERHAKVIRDTQKEYFLSLFDKEGMNNLADDATWRLADSFETIAYHLNKHVIPHIK